MSGVGICGVLGGSICGNSDMIVVGSGVAPMGASISAGELKEAFSPPDRQNLTMRALIIKVLIGIALGAIIAVFALLVVLFGHSAMPV
jgi:hypothetical protein